MKVDGSPGFENAPIELVYDELAIDRRKSDSSSGPHLSMGPGIAFTMPPSTRGLLLRYQHILLKVT